MRSRSLSLFPMPHKPDPRHQTGSSDFHFKEQRPDIRMLKKSDQSRIPGDGPSPVCYSRNGGGRSWEV